MRQFWCIGLSALLFVNSSLGSENTDTVTLNCQIQGKTASHRALKLTLRTETNAPKTTETEAATANKSNSFDQELSQTKKVVASLDHPNNAPVEVLKGFQETYDKNILDLERIDYHPLELLGLSEFDIAHVAFYYAKDESELDNPRAKFKFVLTSIFKSTDESKPVYAGSYGTYEYQNILCHP